MLHKSDFIYTKTQSSRVSSIMNQKIANHIGAYSNPMTIHISNVSKDTTRGCYFITMLIGTSMQRCTFVTILEKINTGYYISNLSALNKPYLKNGHYTEKLGDMTTVSVRKDALVTANEANKYRAGTINKDFTVDLISSGKSGNKRKLDLFYLITTMPLSSKNITCYISNTADIKNYLSNNLIFIRYGEMFNSFRAFSSNLHRYFTLFINSGKNSVPLQVNATDYSLEFYFNAHNIRFFITPMVNGIAVSYLNQKTGFYDTTVVQSVVEMLTCLRKKYLKGYTEIPEQAEIGRLSKKLSESYKEIKTIWGDM